MNLPNMNRVNVSRRLMNHISMQIESDELNDWNDIVATKIPLINSLDHRFNI